MGQACERSLYDVTLPCHGMSVKCSRTHHVWRNRQLGLRVSLQVKGLLNPSTTIYLGRMSFLSFTHFTTLIIFLASFMSFYCSFKSVAMYNKFVKFLSISFKIPLHTYYVPRKFGRIFNVRGIIKPHRSK